MFDKNVIPIYIISKNDLQNPNLICFDFHHGSIIINDLKSEQIGS